MDKKEIPYLVYEEMTIRFERIIERMCLMIVLLIVLLVGSNGAWLYYENQFHDVSTTIEAEQDASGGGANYVVGGNYGTPEGQDNH